MGRYLLFDSGCSLCSGLATDIAVASDGRLAARSLHDPAMQEAVKRVRPEWRWEPTLLEVQGENAHVFTGFALRAQLLTVLGPRRAWRVAQLVARAQTSLGDVDESRRAVVKRGASLAAGVVGLALFGPSTSHAQDGSVTAASLRRPGRNSQREGVESWKVVQRGSNYEATFTHKNPRLSGTVRVAVGGDGKVSSVVLSRGSDRWQVVFSTRTISVTDAEGQAAVGRLEGKRWEVSEQSDRVMRASRTHFRLGLVIAGDVVPVRRPRTGAAEVQLGWQAQATVPNCLEIPDGTCSRDQYIGSSLPSVTLEVAQLQATYALDDKCREASGQPCCCRLKCFCPCLTAFIDPFFDVDAGCGCDCRGNTYP